MAAYVWFMTHVNCRLTAKNQDQLQNATLSNRVWASFTFYLYKEGTICNYYVKMQQGNSITHP